jgi:phosphatidylglycerophosphate synthase
MKRPAYYLVNGITLYRLAAAPVMVFFIFTNHPDIFKWMLPLSFFTDLIDGFLARKLKVTGTAGSKLDSIADDLTIVAAIIGVFVFKQEFIRSNMITISILLFLFFFQMIYALIRYRKLSSFHTYFAKIAAIVQGSFLILLFLLPEPLYWLFYLAAIITTIDLIEEIILVKILPEWETDVKGVYWVTKRKSSEK